MKEKNEADKEGASAGVVLERIVMFLFWVIRWVFARSVVCCSIYAASINGKIFDADASFIYSVLWWLLIWVAIDYYKWHVNRFET